MHPIHSRALVGVTLAMVTGGIVAGDAVAADSAVSLEEVMVTAQRRAQSADDVAIAISAFTGDDLRQRGFEDVGDLALMTPGVTLTDTGITGVPVYTIRGVGFDDYSANSVATVGIYEDEVSLPYPTMTRGPQYDLDRVEILKGPQGTLYGRNTTGGAINLINRRPEAEAGASLLLGYDNWGTAVVEGHVTGALADSLNGRLAGYTRQSDDGWQKSSSRPGDKLGAQDVWAGRLMLAWEASDSLDFLFKLSGYKDSSDNLAPQYFTYVPLVPDLAPFFPPPPVDTRPDQGDNRSADWSATLTPQRDNRGSTMSVIVNWDLSSLQLTSITAFNQFKRDETNDWDGSYIQNLEAISDTKITDYSQEFRLASQWEGPFSLLGGLYFGDDTVDENWQAPGAESTIYLGMFGNVDTRYKQQNKSAAAFAQGELELTQELTLTAGLRYTWEEFDFSSCSYDVDGGLSYLYADYDQGPIPGFADHFYLSSSDLSQGSCVTINPAEASYVVDPDTGETTAYAGASARFSDHKDYDNFSGLLGLNWQVADDALAYLTFNRGFKSGGFNGAAASAWGQLAPYDEETLDAYELGLKATLADGSVRLRTAYFYYDYHDKQVLGFVPDEVFGSLTQIVNVPKSTVQGAEAELEWQLNASLYVSAGVAWLDSEVNEFDGYNSQGQYQDYSGAELAQTPDWQFNATLNYQHPLTESLDATFGVDFNYSDEYYGGLDDTELYYIDGYHVWNGRAGVSASDGSWSLLLIASNFSDENYYTSAGISNDFWYRTRGKPATWGVQWQMSF